MSAALPPRNPFKGLRPFKQEEEEELFGRDRNLILMKDRILSSRTTLLFAGSGVGKTSFLNAKVIPALSERYCVIWHNRWTGADERSDAGIWDDRRPFRIWPPQDLARWFRDRLVEPAWMRQRKKESSAGGVTNRPNDAKAEETESPQRKIAEAVQKVISQSLRSGNKRRLSRILSIFKKKPDSSNQHKPCILILDQFEEIFQYHAYEPYFQDFISDLCKVINDDTYQVRVVFSMREEFLGELSVFDNRIPDLFNNYYRLRYPEKDEARFIITETCKLVNVDPDPENLKKLVDDLATIEKSFEAGAAAGDGAKPVRLVHRNFVPPPYLQIVCDMLWKEQFETPVQNVPATNNGDQKEQKPVRFLENYKRGSENGVKGDDSGAQKAVHDFCEARLSLPFLKPWEQHVAARAFGFLVTKQGAKMAYELRSLASHMDERVWPVKHTLHKLSLPEARILRESRGPEGSYWFELYHDMYAGVVDRWNRRYTREQRRRQQLWFVIFTILVVLASFAVFAVPHWIVYPRQYRQIINAFTEHLDTTDIKNDPSYPTALLAYSNLSETFGYSQQAGVLWARVWQKRAKFFEQKEKREEALLSLLQAAVLAKGDPSENDYLAQANNLLTGNEEAIKQTFCYDCKAARLSPDGKYLFTITNDGDVVLSPTNFTYYMLTRCYECSEAQFSPDSRHILTLRTITEETPKTAGSTDQAQSAERHQTTTSTPSTPESSSQPSPTPNVAKRALGWELRLMPSEWSFQTPVVSFVIKNPQATLSPSAKKSEKKSTSGQLGADSTGSGLKLKSFIHTLDGYLVAGYLQDKLSIWRQDGKPFVESVPVQYLKGEGRSHLGPAASFSPDGRFLVVAGAGLQTELWTVSKTGLTPVTKIELALARQALFSPDGKYLLGISRDEKLKLWELAGLTEVMTIPAPDKIRRYGFAAGSNKFYVTDQNGFVSVFDGDTRQQLDRMPANEYDTSPTIYLANDAKSMVIMWASGFSSIDFEKQAVGTGRKLGQLRTETNDGPIYIDGDGNSVMVLSGSIVRLWDLPPAKDPNWITSLTRGVYATGQLSDDGNTMLMTGESTSDSTFFHLLELKQQREVFPRIKTNYQSYRLSPDGSRVLIRTGEKTIDLYDREKTQAPLPVTFPRSLVEAAFTSDGRYLAVTDDQQIHIVETSKGATQAEFTTKVKATSLAFTPDNKFLLVSRKGSLIKSDNPFAADIKLTTPAVEVWSVSGQKVNFKLEKPESVQAVAISNDRIVMFQNHKVLVFNLKDATKVKEFEYGQDLAYLSISPDGRFVVTCDSKGLIQLWQADSGMLNGRIFVGSAVERIIFDADGASLIAMTDGWVHQVKILTSLQTDGGLEADATLEYVKGIFTGKIYPGSVRLLTADVQAGIAPDKYLRWLRDGVNGLELAEGSFDGRHSKQILTGDSDTLRDTWQSKLGFTVMPNGILEEKIQVRSWYDSR